MPTRTPTMLQDPLVKRGTAFTEEERAQFGLIERLPSAVSTLEQQANRAYAQLESLPNDLSKNMVTALSP
jgi:malate dehydrogenase (oxaloacetate-decarboxylating)